MNKKESFKALVQGEMPVLVDFYADWCGPCKAMAPMLTEFSRQMQGRIRVIKIDVDRNPAAAQQYGIQGVPTLILFRQGEIKWRQSGVVSVQAMKQAVQPYLQ
jgi:thioredoxin 1